MRKCIAVILSLCILLGGLILGPQAVFGLGVEGKAVFGLEAEGKVGLLAPTVRKIEVSPLENFSRYEAEKKSPWLAVGAAWLVPTLGHAYAGDWGRGINFLVADVACYGIVIIGSNMMTISSRGAALYLIGYVGLLVSRICEYVDAYKTAEDYNKKLAEKCGIRLSLHQGPPYLQLSYKF